MKNKKINKFPITGRAQHGKEKGFSFAFDGIVAVLVLLAVMTYVTLGTPSNFEFSSQKVVQKQIADDVLFAAVDTNNLSTMDNGQVNGAILSAIPQNYDYQLLIEKYTLTNQFNLATAQTYGNTGVDLNTVNYVESKKLFLTFYQNDINAYYSAKLRVWLR